MPVAPPRSPAEPEAPARECGPGFRSIMSQASPIEAVDDLSRLRAVECDHLDDLLPTEAADLDPPPGWFEPVAEPGVALPGVVLDPPADLAADGSGEASQAKTPSSTRACGARINRARSSIDSAGRPARRRTSAMQATVRAAWSK